VFQQTPGAGQPVAKDTAITLIASKGPTQVTVPNESGKNAVDAANNLGQLGFQTDTQEQVNDTVPQGQVIGTNPPAGAQANKGATITIFVSSGPAQKVVPDVRCLSKAGADAAINAAGLAPSSSGPINGVVKSQSPAANSKADPGSTVSYVLVSPTPPDCGGTTTTTTSNSSSASS
jgi:serine/threonine-protein kinase